MVLLPGETCNSFFSARCSLHVFPFNSASVPGNLVLVASVFLRDSHRNAWKFRPVLCLFSCAFSLIPTENGWALRRPSTTPGLRYDRCQLQHVCFPLFTCRIPPRIHVTIHVKGNGFTGGKSFIWWCQNHPLTRLRNDLVSWNVPCRSYSIACL